MGQTLSEPITSKESTSLCNNKVIFLSMVVNMTKCELNDLISVRFQFKVGSSCMQGWRVSMEDAHCHILSLTPEDPSAS